MFFMPTGGYPGRCVVGDEHNATGSIAFVLPFNVPETPGTQRGWRYCRHCQLLFFEGNVGSCINGVHDASGSFDFVLPFDGSHFIPVSHKIDEGPEMVPAPD
jgi:hypothetical protein